MSNRKLTNRRGPSILKPDIDRSYDKLVYWLYERRDYRRAKLFADRLATALESRPDVGKIFVEDCWSLIYEARQDLPKAIKHREKEIRLISKLHELARDADFGDFVLRQYDFADLRDSLDTLAMLYHDAGNITKAVRILYQSKSLCKSQQIKFDSASVLKEWEAIAAKCDSSRQLAP